MSLKFEKYRSVPFGYHAMPLKYTGVKHPQNKDKEFVIIDILADGTFVCAWRNEKTCKVGINFKCKRIIQNKKVFINYKNRLIPLASSGGWVF